MGDGSSFNSQSMYCR